ncbi:RluA family pseudouridine synthase [Bacillus chungangensis]|uniref:Pseudouridine synthase n=1 Tax=Bacillus chungangensis TaxID=587633 RepID=A0ABT9WWP7_9BACI|nr:RluA family pseudouridine synthase [Bacillus chungangensis]MDQ0177642.1 23S rRNA pseudouridine1911/1915/1917 synthase [Bacillus chungangensis]
MEIKKYTILEHQHEERLDKVVASLHKEWSRSQVQQWIKDGNVLVNNRQSKANYKCTTGDDITIQVPEKDELIVSPERMDLDIAYEDDDVIVINKPKGMVVHPAAGHSSGTLANGLKAHCGELSDLNGPLRPGIVHRIDKDTSGLLMAAKNNEAHQQLVGQLVDKTVTRKYCALVHGRVPHDDGTVDAPIGRDPEHRQRMAVVDNGKKAVTHFHVLERFQDYTLLECTLETGRTHQIRVHMQYIGFPLVGDPTYGPKKTLQLEGQALHAGLLGFQHPRTEEYLEFRAPLPAYFTTLLASLRKND